MVLMSGISWCLEIFWTLLAGVGGLVKALREVLKGTEKFAWSRVIARIIISGFSGLMVAKTTELLDPTWATIAAGIGGYLGTEALDSLVEVIRGRLPKAAEKTDETGKKSED